ncbi:hypothetical protein ACGGAQ_02240 [Micromonospora sp. NPDC047557]|uniref:hypothetical protein n=1 Tax=Micromonospora sp. NPDC047557 TaxID=3364250 RepID=UPI0037220A74
MIERGGGRTSGQTDWHLMDVNSMWACLQDHDTTNHWKQVAGWRKVCDLAQIHLGRLQEYRRGLAEAWPPETSAASGTYLAQLDDLIAKVRHTHDAAAANYTALSAATQAIGTTRAELRKIHEEYATKLQQKQAYDATAADPKAIMGNRVVESPVTDSDLERLNVQARAMMFNLSGELQQAQATLQKPPALRPPIQSGDPDALGAASVAPVIPPIIPLPMQPLVKPTTARPATDLTAPIAQAQGVGPVLGGAGIGLASGPPTASPMAPSLPTASQAPLGPGLPPSGPISSRAPSPPNPADRPASSAKGRQYSSPSSPLRPVPPGGLIGGATGPGLISPGPGPVQPRKVNPIGGVIGGGGAGTGPTGGAGSRPGSGRSFSGSLQGNPTPFGGGPSLGHSTGMGPTSRHQGHLREEDDKVRRWDPDNPWETDQGVEPIVRPADERGPIDPGPAIGFDR